MAPRKTKAPAAAPDPIGERLERLNQERFAQLYVTYRNAEKAYMEAYEVSYETATSNAYRLMGNAGVKSRIQQLLDADLAEIEITRRSLTQALGRRAASAASVSLEDIAEAIASGQRLTREQRLAIKKRKDTRNGVEIELWDPTPMIAQLAKLGGWEAPQQVQVTAQTTVNQQDLSKMTAEELQVFLADQLRKSTP